jgi:hypothetical protein
MLLLISKTWYAGSQTEDPATWQSSYLKNNRYSSFTQPLDNTILFILKSKHNLLSVAQVFEYEH